VHGDTTAKAVEVLWALDAAILLSTNGENDLDDLFYAVVHDSEKFTTDRLQTLAEELTGTSFQAFFERHVPAR
jgi:predicted metalloprotease with PDZ domain